MIISSPNGVLPGAGKRRYAGASPFAVWEPARFAQFVVVAVTLAAIMAVMVMLLFPDPFVADATTHPVAPASGEESREPWV